MPLFGPVGWELLAYTKLTGSSGSIGVTGLPNRRFLMVMVHSQGQSGAQAAGIQFNGDVGTNYAQTNANGLTYCGSGAGAKTVARFIMWYVHNTAADAKQSWCGGCQGTASNANVDNDGAQAGVWNNTTALINQVNVMVVGGATWNSGCELWVYGLVG